MELAKHFEEHSAACRKLAQKKSKEENKNAVWEMPKHANRWN
jgi:hypothetical protein